MARPRFALVRDAEESSQLHRVGDNLAVGCFRPMSEDESICSLTIPHRWRPGHFAGETECLLFEKRDALIVRDAGLVLDVPIEGMLIVQARENTLGSSIVAW